jgi:hypothetical protein
MRIKLTIKRPEWEYEAHFLEDEVHFQEDHYKLVQDKANYQKTRVRI